MAKNYSPEIADLLDAMLDKAAQCMQEKAFLQAVDWSRVEAGPVEKLLTALDKAGKKAPPWLLSALLTGGHHIDEQLVERMSLPFKFLNRLNSGAKTDDAATITANDIAARQIEDGDIALALVRALKEAGLERQALQLALANWQHTPKLLRPVSPLLKAARNDLDKVKIRLLGSSTTNPLAQDLPTAFAAQGFDAHISEAGFAEYMPELLRPADEDFDLYILQLDMEGLAPRDWRQDSAENIKLLNERLDMLIMAMNSFVQDKNIPLLINSIPLPPVPALGFADPHHVDGASTAIKLINRRLADLASEQNQITLIDSFAALSAIAPQNWSDPKMWFYGRIPFGAEAVRAFASRFAQSWRAQKRGPAKVLAIDLDNTMWGGIFGEDGVTGLQCGDDFPGNAFKAMQNEFLRLKRQGLILAILSKNNPDAISAFADHPGIIMNEDDFVAHRINWTPKPQNIRELASEINVGLDSFVFLDDSPHEREAMRALAPEVLTPELPEDPARRPGFLRAIAKTWPVRLTDEDAQRSLMYEARRKAGELQSSAGSFEDYLQGLEQKLRLEEVSDTTLPRIAQMHQKTNQFNLTTRRFDESDIRAMMEDEQHKVILGQVIDKFGDHGITIAASVQISGERAQIKSLLMSCRVIGREVETAFLGAVLENLQQEGVKTVTASYIPTVKNVIVADFYKQHGFEQTGNDGDKTLWRWNGENSDLPTSRFVETDWRS